MAAMRSASLVRASLQLMLTMTPPEPDHRAMQGYKRDRAATQARQGLRAWTRQVVSAPAL